VSIQREILAGYLASEAVGQASLGYAMTCDEYLTLFRSLCDRLPPREAAKLREALDSRHMGSIFLVLHELEEYDALSRSMKGHLRVFYDMCVR
jgi:hypothetical protein